MKKSNTFLITLFLISAMYLGAMNIQPIDNTPKPCTIKTYFGDLIKTALFKAKSVVFPYKPSELNKMFFDATFINPDFELNYLKALIKYGTQVNAQFNNLTPLHGALTNGYFGNTKRTIQLLLDNGARVDTQIIKFAKDQHNPANIIGLLENKIKNKK